MVNDSEKQQKMLNRLVNSGLYRISFNRLMEFTDCNTSVTCDITRDDSRIGAIYGEEGPESDRQTCRFARAHAPDDAQHEPGKAWRCFGPYVPAGPEIRKGHQPHRREPPAADRAHSPGAGFLLLRRRAGFVVWLRFF